MEYIKEISIKEMKGFKIGHADDNIAMTGVTAIVFDKPVVCGVDISGGGPASRETPLLDSKMACTGIDAIILSGGSAFGLDASSGVMAYLEEHNIGFDTGYAKVPLVCQSSIFDLSFGKSDVRPNFDMGYKACENAIYGNELSGNIGAGKGATVGKLGKMKQAMKAGIGISTVSLGELKVTAIACVNALGDIFDFESNKKIAGMLDIERKEFINIEELMYKSAMESKKETVSFTKNTTIGAVITNGTFSKGDMNKIASMVRNAYARCISPVGTTADGDTIYAAATGEIEQSDVNLVGTLATRAMCIAIRNAISESQMDEKLFLENCIEYNR